MYCKKCGNQIDNDSIYCSYCGSKQSNIIIENNISKEDQKVLNVNLSFGKQNTINQTIKPQILNRKVLIFDPTYQKESDALIAGIVMLIAMLIIFLISKGVNDKEFYSVSTVILSILRILFTVWGGNIAKRQNRNSIAWGFLTFFFPAISLIILGTQNKLFDNFGINDNLTDQENSIRITEKANSYLQNKEFYKCIVYCEKAL